MKHILIKILIFICFLALLLGSLEKYDDEVNMLEKAL